MESPRVLHSPNATRTKLPHLPILKTVLVIIVILTAYHCIFHYDNFSLLDRFLSPNSSGDVSPRRNIPAPSKLPDDKFYQVSDLEIFIYSGFLDLRFDKPMLRLFGVQGPNLTAGHTCKYEGHNSQPVKANYPIYDSWPSKKLHFQAHVMQCEVPKSVVEIAKLTGAINVSIGHENSGYDKSIAVKMIGTTAKPRRTLAICVKAMWGKVNPVKLIEWIEFNRHLGVEKIIVYDVLTLGPARQVLLYYQRLGFVEVVQFTYAQKMSLLMQTDPMVRKLFDNSMAVEQSYLVALNDCYYSNRDSFTHLMVLDIDEIIVPADGMDLVEFIKVASDKAPMAASFLFQAAWHLDEYGAVNNSQAPAQTHLHMQRYLRRSPVNDSQPKSIIDTDKSITINWHASVTIPIGPKYHGNTIFKWQNFGFLHHFRKRCKLSTDLCKRDADHVVVDEALPKYRIIMDKLVKEAALNIFNWHL